MREKESLEKEIEELELLIGKLEESFAFVEENEYGNLKQRTDKYEEAKIALDQKTERWLELEEKA